MAFHGLRGAGKTVLVRQLADEARQRNWLVVHRELRTGVEWRPFLAQALQATCTEFEQESKLRKLTKRLRGVLASFSASIGSDGSIRVGIEAAPARGIADSGELETDTVELLAEAGAVAREAGAGLLLALDELHELEEGGLEALTAALHRASQTELPVALICAGLPHLPLRLIEAKTYAERLYTFPRLGALSESASEEALRVPAEREDVRFDNAALKMIVERSEGYPYFLQEWGRAVWNAAEKSPVSVDDVERASSRVRDELDEEFFGMRLARTTSVERRYMAAMAELGDGPQRSAEVARLLRKAQRQVSPQRASLIEKGLIYSPAYGDVDFTVPRYGDFMRRRWPLPELASG